MLTLGRTRNPFIQVRLFSSSCLLKSSDVKSIYRLEDSPSAWGDYGDILRAGMTAHLGRLDGLLQLERVGPFVPPISFPGISDIVVTDNFRKSLENSGLTGFTFQPVIKRRIVFLEWEKWNRPAEEPVEYPSTGEPEDYILERPHSPELAQQIGDLWEVCLSEYAGVNEVQADWFRLPGSLHNFVSERAQVWLKATVSEWVRFTQVHTD